MQSWKTHLLMMLAIAAMLVAVSVPAIADEWLVCEDVSEHDGELWCLVDDDNGDNPDWWPGDDDWGHGDDDDDDWGDDFGFDLDDVEEIEFNEAGDIVDIDFFDSDEDGESDENDHDDGLDFNGDGFDWDD